MRQTWPSPRRSARASFSYSRWAPTSLEADTMHGQPRFERPCFEGTIPHERKLRRSDVNSPKSVHIPHAFRRSNAIHGYRGERYCLPACTDLGQDPTDTKFRSSCRSPPRGHSRSIHPHYLSGHASTNHFEGVARITASRFLIDSLQPSILGLWLRATPAGIAPACRQTISSPHVHRFVM
jgi:hypothetical protein